MNKTITFLLPGGSFNKPVGGYKVVYEYANRLIEDGFDVNIVYPYPQLEKYKSLIRKAKRIIKIICIKTLKGYKAKRWFNLNPKIQELFVPSLEQKNIPISDYYFATAIQTAMSLKDYNTGNARKLYLIQDFENWEYPDEIVFSSYRYGFENIAISSWLCEKVIQTGANCHLIKNGFDFDYFRCTIPIENKDKYKISMLYHNDIRKGCKYGLEALEIVKRRYPQLQAILFGYPSRPKWLPDWIVYYQKPNKETHNKIYNECAINLAPSLQEGWGLTVGEAMMCGEAIVCTETLGFREMVKSGENGLTVPIKDSKALADKIIFLIENDNCRIDIAKNGLISIQSFTWDKSYKKLKGLLLE